MKQDIKLKGLAHYTLKNGGQLQPLLINAKETGGTGLMNPSVFIDYDGKILVNIRHVNYTLYHSEGKGFPHQWGPLQYIHPEDDLTLRTTNFIAELNDDLSVKTSYKVDMKFDTAPLWNFIGLEDARLVRWNDKLYLCGVRRDHLDAKGKGRMDLSELQFNGTTYEEVARYSIPAPPPNMSYCEKNWMPILDKPYHWVKWSNPTEIVSFDIETNETKTVHCDHQKVYAFPRDLRGGSQVVEWKDHYVAITHEVNLYKDGLGRKDGKYLQRIVVWDKSWNIVKSTDEFSFMKGEIEFVTGLAFHNGTVLISFGFQDNAAYILSMPEALFEKIIMKG
jgi:hypothetical protein